jgi:hypothetical protein
MVSRLIDLGKGKKPAEVEKKDEVVLLNQIKGTEVEAKPARKPIYLDVKEDESIILSWIDILTGRNK